MNYILYNGELYHHGIKGQKWGVRRYQKEDGSLTPAGKERYNSDSENPVKKKSKHYARLEQRYLDSGMTPEEAQKATIKRIKTEKVLAAASAVAVTAAAAYVVNKKIKERSDGIVKSGESLQRIERFNSEGVLHENFYAAIDKHDKTKYAGMLGSRPGAHIMDIKVDKDVKVAGNKTGLKTFEELYKNNGDFRRQVTTSMPLAKRNVHGRNFANGNMKKMYENFNTNLIYRESPAVQQFYDELSKKGYGAVKDINDMKFSGYKAKNPLIFFNSKNSVSVRSVREMTSDEANKALLKAGKRELAAMASKGVVMTTTMSSLAYYMKGLYGNPKAKVKVNNKKEEIQNGG